MTKLIKDWEELSKVPQNEKYKLEIDLEFCNGWITPLFEVSDKDYYKHNIYLSTHTFYGKTGTPNILKDYGWDIELDNWDKNK